MDHNRYSLEAMEALHNARWPFGSNYDGHPGVELVRAKHSLKVARKFLFNHHPANMRMAVENLLDATERLAVLLQGEA